MLLETQRPELQQGKLYTVLEEIRREKKSLAPDVFNAFKGLSQQQKWQISCKQVDGSGE